MRKVVYCTGRGNHTSKLEDALIAGTAKATLIEIPDKMALPANRDLARKNLKIGLTF